ncbi:four-carbon acid sugar kinase family protein [Alicyclobacillus dauci]|uniref:Four-carbon acid sugar kinase family protein n=1 Tax=Alicyclobacillus dauci TaxID=1475485 RepID=A0ABY6Z206_9BACL|nr:four-carbon acid sugar kinase family protein [Alicyclobacillus dauci]WAH36251.1 four-carbon acid sugar kinase family protein [Alicyclobacillus dauci]WAH39427.1 four-carbon acid sugar kinase family protein [Alicyclobacillus dauci]
MTKGQRIYVIADDLTGAADAANYFRTGSHQVRVSFRSDSPWVFSLGSNIVQVFDSESRALDEDTARQIVMNAGEQLRTSPNVPFLVYKKIDSTLRGHVGSEIEAFLKSLHRRVAVLAPTFPANGRIVQNGTLYVNGSPVSQTDFANDPRNPVTQDRVADLVRQTTTLPVIELTEDVLARGIDVVAEFIEGAAHKEAIIVADSTTNEELAVIAKAIAYNSSVLPCGSAGLAKQLAACWLNDASESESNLLPQQMPSCEHVLVAVGSANPVAHRQLEHVTRTYQSSIVELQPLLLAKQNTHAIELQRGSDELVHCSDQPVAGVTLAPARAMRDSALPGSFESDLAYAVNQWTESMSDRNAIGFVATGGDTALALCEALNAAAIWPEGEVIAGIPWSWIETSHGKIPLVSKAGGFGAMSALTEAAGFLLNKCPV